MTELWLASLVELPAGSCAGGSTDELVAYVREHCATVTLAQLALQFNLHPNTAAARVRRAAGMPFAQLVRALRVERAERLLREKGASVEQVAWACGYESASALYRAFKAERGTTPRGAARG